MIPNLRLHFDLLMDLSFLQMMDPWIVVIVSWIPDVGLLHI